MRLACDRETAGAIVDLIEAGFTPEHVASQYPFLTHDQLQEAIRHERRARRKAARSTPEAKANRSRGRIQKRRGYDSEKRTEKRLERFGFYRQPLSGALRGARHGGDLQRDGAGVMHRCENKRRQGAQKGMRAYLAQDSSDFVVIDPAGGEEPLVFCTLAKFETLLGEARYDADKAGAY